MKVNLIVAEEWTARAVEKDPENMDWPGIEP